MNNGDEVYVLTVSSRNDPDSQTVWFNAYTTFLAASRVASDMLPRAEMKQIGRNMWQLRHQDGTEVWIYRLYVNTH